MSNALYYRIDIDLQEIVDQQAREMQRIVDEATLDKAADTLAYFGYVKVNGDSRWFQLFGTPEKAARTVCGIIHHEADCGEGACPIYAFCDEYMDEEITADEGYDALLEWLFDELTER